MDVDEEMEEESDAGKGADNGGDITFFWLLP